MLPLSVILVMLATAEPVPPVCVIVIDIVLDVLRVMLPKSRVLGDMLRVAGGVYVPVMLILDGDTLAALLVTAKVAFLEPAVVGVKVTFTVVDWPWFSVMVLENDVLNSLALVPVREMPVIEMAGEPAAPVCVRVTGRVAEPLLSVPNASPLGEMLMLEGGAEAPVPLSDTLIGDELLPVCAMRSEADFEPVLVGLNVTLTVAVCP